MGVLVLQEAGYPGGSINCGLLSRVVRDSSASSYVFLAHRHLQVM